MVFVFSPYIRKCISCFQFQVSFTFNDFTAQIMLKIICVPIITLNYHFLSKIITVFTFLSMLFFFFFFLSLNSRNSITIVPINVKLGNWSLRAGESSTIFYVNPFTTRMPIVIGPSHTLVHELSGSNLAHTRHDHIYPQIFTLTLLLLEYR